MSVGRGLAVNRPAQVERLDDFARLQLEVRPHQVRQLGRVQLRRAESVHTNADRVGHADGISELHFAALGQFGSHNVFRDVSRHVGRRAVYFRRVLAAERAAAVPAHATISVHDDFAAGQSGIAHGPADHEPSRGIDVVLGVLIQQVRRNHRLNHLLLNARAQLVVAHVFGVLGRNHDRIHAHHFSVGVVFDRDLGFSIGTEEGKRSILADLRKPLRELVRQRNRRRHQFLGFIARKPKHHSLVAGAAGVHAHGDVAGLAVDAGNHGAGVGIESIERVVVADGGHRAPHDALKVYVGFGGDFAGDDDQTGGGQSFASDAAGDVVGQAGVKNGVGNLVRDFIGMAFGHRFGSK